MISFGTGSTMWSLLFIFSLFKTLIPPGFAASLHGLSEEPQIQAVFLDASSAHRFLGRKILYNHWDFELFVPGNLERECREEVCNYEEAREVFEDDLKTAEIKRVGMDIMNKNAITNASAKDLNIKMEKFWETYPHNGKGGARTPVVDVAGLVAGLIAALVSIIMFIIVAMYCIKYHAKERSRVRIQESLNPGIPLANFVEEPKPECAPGLPSYEQAMASPGVHDAPPPPYNRNNANLTPPT